MMRVSKIHATETYYLMDVFFIIIIVVRTLNWMKFNMRRAINKLVIRKPLEKKYGKSHVTSVLMKSWKSSSNQTNNFL